MKGRRFGADVVVLILFLVALTASAVWRGAAPKIREPERRTIRAFTPDGWRALALVLRERGTDVRVVERRATLWPRPPAVVISGPQYQESSDAWSRNEALAAKRWVAEGGTLFLLTARRSQLLTELHLEIEETGDAEAISSPTVAFPALRGAARLVTPEKTRWSALPADAVAVAKDAARVVAAVVPMERGRVVAVASAGIADNAHLARQDNARFLVSWIEAYALSAGRKVYFDEFRQGFHNEQTLGEYIGWQGRAIVGQLAAVALLAALAVGRRFGLARPLPPLSRLSSEYVMSLADLYRQAGARDVVIACLVTQLRRDLCRRWGLAPADDATLVRHATHAAPSLAPQLRSLLADCHAALERPRALEEASLLSLTRRIADVRKEMGLDR